MNNVPSPGRRNTYLLMPDPIVRFEAKPLSSLRGLEQIKKVCFSGFYAEKPFASPVESLQVERFAPLREEIGVTPF